jgi:hypothetical protein
LVITYGSTRGYSWFPQVRPHQLAGLEINPYAQQLAQVVIWIGFLQWLHHNGFATPSDPVLEPIDNIRPAWRRAKLPGEIGHSCPARHRLAVRPAARSIATRFRSAPLTRCRAASRR